MKYDAFISYSHDADKRWASALRRTVQRCARPWYRRHGVRVFLDASNASATPRLKSYLHDQVRESRSFVLLASEKSAASPWVMDELETFLAARPTESPLLVLTSGTIAWASDTADFDWEHTTALPRQLSGRYSEEPKYVDLRWATDHADAPSDPRFQDAAAEIVAAIQGRSKDEIVGEDLRQHRRTLRLATGAAAVLALLLAAALAAGWYATVQRRNAEAQRNTAERRFKDVRHLANTFLFEFHDAIDDLPGTTPAQRLVVDKALEYLDSLAREASGNAELLGELASAYERVGLLQGGAVASHLGDTAGALVSFRKAIDIQNQRIALQGPAPELRSDLSVDYELLGDVLKVQGDREGARKMFLDSLAICEELARRFPENERYFDRLATVYEKLGDVAILDPKDSNARAHYQRYLQMSEEQASRAPRSYSALHSLGLAYGKWADLLWRDGAHEEARGFYQKQSEYFARLAALDPDKNAHARRDLALSDIDLADAQADLEDWPGADAYYRRAIEALDRLVRDDPKNVQFRSNLAYAHGSYGSTLADQERAAEAGREYKAAIGVLEDIVQIDAGNRSHLWNLSSLYNEYADVVEEGGQLADAIALHRKDVAILEPLTRGLDDYRSQRELAISYHNLALVLDKAEDAAGAIDFYTRSTEVSRRMAQKFPNDAATHGDVADSLDELVTLSRKDPAQALRYAREAVASRTRATALADGTDSAQYRELADEYSILADLQAAAKELEAALESRRNAITAAERAAAIAPADREIRGEVALAHTKLARLLGDLGRPTDAVPAFEEARSWRERDCAEPCSDAAARDLMYVLGELATADAAIGRFDDALAQSRRAAQFQERFAGPGSDAGARNALATLLSRYGEALDRVGRYDEAVRAHVAARDQFKRLATMQPVRAGADIEVSHAAARAGWAAFKGGQLLEADRHFQTSLRDWGSAKVSRPTTTFAIDRARQALVEARLDRREAAAKRCAGIVPVLDAWGKEGASWRAMRDTGLASLYCSEALLRARDAGESLAFARTAGEKLAAAKQMAPQNVLVRSALGRAYLAQADSDRALGLSKEACVVAANGVSVLGGLNDAQQLASDDRAALARADRSGLACEAVGTAGTP